MAAVTERLAARIGPLARVLVKREAAAGGPLAAVVERLAVHVPDAAERAAFVREAAALA